MLVHMLTPLLVVAVCAQYSEPGGQAREPYPQPTVEYWAKVCKLVVTVTCCQAVPQLQGTGAAVARGVTREDPHSLTATRHSPMDLQPAPIGDNGDGVQILLPSAVHLEERLTVSQSVS